MNKVICDICGTTYQDSADCCPICGCSRDAAALLGEELLVDEYLEEQKPRGGRYAPRKKKEIFDYDEVNAEYGTSRGDQNPYAPEEEHYEAAPRHNTFAVIMLTILIALLLLAAAFLFIRFYLPNAGSNEPTVSSVPQTSETFEPLDLSVPCQNLVLTSGTARLEQEGAFFLIHVVPYPEDTTDKIIYESADESIATVDDNGRITAVAEGETVIYITCGLKQLPCEVVCSFEEAPEPSDATMESTTATEETTIPETTEGLKNVVLKLKDKDNDITLGVGQTFTLLLDCDLEQTDVEWRSTIEYIASVDENGKVTANSKGNAFIKIKYGDQEISCAVRVK